MDHPIRHDRRTILISCAAASLPVAGCGTDTVQDAVAEIETETLEDTMVVLRGFEIVSWSVGKRVIWLPLPATRIIGVALILSAGVAKLAIIYLDTELKRRTVEESLEPEEAARIESDQAVTFNLQNGETEQVLLGPNQYVD